MGTQDPTFGVDDFNRPKLLSESETFITNILTILMGKPGFYPSIPTLGMNISQYLYMLEEDIDCIGIKAKLVQQCNDFLPIVESGEMDILTTTVNNSPVLIFQLPVLENGNTKNIALGVTINTKGEMVYNFTESDIQQII